MNDDVEASGDPLGDVLADLVQRHIPEAVLRVFVQHPLAD